MDQNFIEKKTNNEKFENKFNDYLIHNTIGKGTFGKVKLGIHIPTNEKIAIKILEKNKITDEDDIIRIDREMKICKSLYHLNVIKIFEVKNLKKLEKNYKKNIRKI
jgi:serine/threonine protein kinase